MTYLLAHPSVKFSAKLLAKELGLKRLLEPGRKAPLIRWGISDYANSFVSGADTVLNRAELIYITGNKLRFSRAMQDAQIPHVDIKTGIPNHFPVVVRQQLSASKGMGIVVCGSLQEFRRTPRNDYWSYWHNFKYELGVHMLGGEIVKVMKKVREDDLEDEEFPIRNSGRGYHFSRRNIEKYSKLLPFMRGIYQAFPLEFGRWDIGWDIELKSYVVIEANSAPDLTQNDDTLEIYVNFLAERLGITPTGKVLSRQEP